MDRIISCPFFYSRKGSLNIWPEGPRILLFLSFPVIIFPHENLLFTKEHNALYTLHDTVEMNKYFIITNFLYQ
jgi:hypothetical protein